MMRPPVGSSQVGWIVAFKRFGDGGEGFATRAVSRLGVGEGFGGGGNG
jgi:hypothetical protein